MLHDIEYLLNAGSDPSISDIRAIKNSDWSLPGVITKTGMVGKLALNKLGVYMNTSGSYQPSYLQQVGKQAYHYVLTDPDYSRLFRLYNIPFDYVYSRNL
jgi:hypothetical protein